MRGGEESSGNNSMQACQIVNHIFTPAHLSLLHRVQMTLGIPQNIAFLSIPHSGTLDDTLHYKS